MQGHNSYDQQGYPQQGYPQQGVYPQPGYPQPGYPQPYYPQQGFPIPPSGGFINPSYPDQGGFASAGSSYPSSNSAAPPYGVNNTNLNIGEDEEVKNFDFTEKSIRLGFIRKVYAILMCQLLVTFGFIALCLFHNPTKKYIQTHHELWWIAFVVMLVSIIAMGCCGNVRRKAPMNYIFLSLFTLAESFMLATVTSAYDADSVLIAVGVTAVVCLALTIFAFQTKWDFTSMGGFLMVAVVILILFGILSIFFYNKILVIVYASLGALIFSMYLVYDTQLMMGGNHKYSISPEEYIFAALNLYLDIINIFLYILTIIGATKD